MSLYSEREALLMEKNARLETQLQNKDLEQEVKKLQLQNKDLQQMVSNLHQEVNNLRMDRPVPAGKPHDHASHIAMSSSSSGMIAHLRSQNGEKDATIGTIRGPETSPFLSDTRAMYPGTPTGVTQRPAAFAGVEDRRSYFDDPTGSPQRAAKHKRHELFGEAATGEDEGILGQRKRRYRFPESYQFGPSAFLTPRGSQYDTHGRPLSHSSLVGSPPNHDLEATRESKRDSPIGYGTSSPGLPETFSVAGGVSIQESHSNSQLASHTSSRGLLGNVAAESSPTSASISRSEAQISSSGPPQRKPLAGANSASSNTPESVNQDRHQAPELASTPANFPASNAEPPPPPQLTYSQAMQKPRGQATRRANVPRGPTPSTPTHPEFLTAKGAQEKPADGAYREQTSQKPDEAHGKGVSRGQSDPRRRGDPRGRGGSRSNKGLTLPDPFFKMQSPLTVINEGPKATGKESFFDKLSRINAEMYPEDPQPLTKNDEAFKVSGNPLQSQKDRLAAINAVSSAKSGPQSTDSTKDSSTKGSNQSNPSSP